jgi:glycosyltransferase involved in cell wall biosynthesis
MSLKNKFLKKILNLKLLIKKVIYINFYQLFLIQNKFLAHSFLVDIFYKKKFSFLNSDFLDDNIEKKIKKKVILITGQLTFGGSEVQIIKIAQQLKKNKIDVKIVSLVFGKYKKIVIPKKIKIDYIKTTNKNYKVEKNYLLKHKLNFFFNKSIFNDFEKLQLFKLYDYLKKEKPEIVYAHLDFYCIITGILSIYLKINNAILSTRSSPIYNFTFYRLYYKSAYKALHKFKKIKFVNNSKKNSNLYNIWLKFPKGTFKTIYNIFDFNKKYKIKKIKSHTNENSIKIGSVLRFDPEKNPIYLLKLMHYLVTKNHNCICYIVGDGSMKEVMKKYIKKNNLKNKIILTDNKINIIDYFNFFDIFLLTSKHEGTPNVLLEAQSVGTPVICTNVGGNSECTSAYTRDYIYGKSYKVDGEIILNLISKNKFYKKRNTEKIKNNLSKFMPKNSIKPLLKLCNARIN